MIHRKSKLYRAAEFIREGLQRTVSSGGDQGGNKGREYRRVPHGDIYAAGSVVRESGIYEVLHDQEHRSSHEVVMIADDTFPACEVCDDLVRYRVVRTAPYIFSDEDFEDPSR